MLTLIGQPVRTRSTFDLDGAAATARWMERWGRHRDGKT
jgi:hypothetical protein